MTDTKTFNNFKRMTNEVYESLALANMELLDVGNGIFSLRSTNEELYVKQNTIANFGTLEEVLAYLEGWNSSRWFEKMEKSDD
jgi:hypothetical protein